VEKAVKNDLKPRETSAVSGLHRSSAVVRFGDRFSEKETWTRAQLGMVI
jgi:hypothetical protein